MKGKAGHLNAPLLLPISVILIQARWMPGVALIARETDQARFATRGRAIAVATPVSRPVWKGRG